MKDASIHRVTDVPKETFKRIKRDIEDLETKYGENALRYSAQKLFRDWQDKKRLQKELDKKRAELEKLEKELVK